MGMGDIAGLVIVAGYGLMFAGMVLNKDKPTLYLFLAAMVFFVGGIIMAFANGVIKF